MAASSSTSRQPHASLLRAYYAVLKPERTLANVMTTAAGFLLAAAWHIDAWLFAATIVGTSLVVASACAVNNATDRRLDAKMPRTNKRALVVGLIPVTHVIGLAVVLGVAGFALLLTYVNWLTAAIGAIGYIDYVLLYAWSKRRTVHSTLIGTISGSAPLVAGYTAVSGQLDATAVLLGFVMLFWQMAHFFAIGVYRVEDYRLGGLPIFSVVHGVKRTEQFVVLYIVLFIACLLAVPFGDKLSAVSLLLVVPLAVRWLWRSFGTADTTHSQWGRQMFAGSLTVLLVLCGTIAIGGILP